MSFVRVHKNAARTLIGRHSQVFCSRMMEFNTVKGDDIETFSVTGEIHINICGIRLPNREQLEIVKHGRNDFSQKKSYKKSRRSLRLLETRDFSTQSSDDAVQGSLTRVSNHETEIRLPHGCYTPEVLWDSVIVNRCRPIRSAADVEVPKLFALLQRWLRTAC